MALTEVAGVRPSIPTFLDQVGPHSHKAEHLHRLSHTDLVHQQHGPTLEHVDEHLEDAHQLVPSRLEFAPLRSLGLALRHIPLLPLVRPRIEPAFRVLVRVEVGEDLSRLSEGLPQLLGSHVLKLLDPALPVAEVKVRNRYCYGLLIGLVDGIEDVLELLID